MKTFNYMVAILSVVGCLSCTTDEDAMTDERPPSAGTSVGGEMTQNAGGGSQTVGGELSMVLNGGMSSNLGNAGAIGDSGRAGADVSDTDVGGVAVDAMGGVLMPMAGRTEETGGMSGGSNSPIAGERLMAGSASGGGSTASTGGEQADLGGHRVLGGQSTGGGMDNEPELGGLSGAGGIMGGEVIQGGDNGDPPIAMGGNPIGGGETGGAPGEQCPRADGPRVQICDQRLFVSGDEFFMKGINWSPHDRGSRPDFGPPNFVGNVDRDARMMAAIGINVVKLYSPLTDMDVLDTLYAQGIHVVQSVFGYWDTNGDQQFDDRDLDEIDRVIQNSKRGGKVHPAIIMWSVGNEWNYNGFYNEAQWGNGHCWQRDGNAGGPPPTYACPQAVDAAIRAFERVKAVDTSIPLSTIWGEVPSDALMERLDPFVDVWASNVYRFNTFGQAPNDLFGQFRALTDKPFYVGEYGCDAWNTNEDQLDEPAQADCNTELATAIANRSTLNGGGTIGGFLFEWNDEWWKAPGGRNDAHDNTPGGVPGAGPAPDARFNEEYWGIVDVFRQPRQSYYEFCAVENPMANSNPDMCPTPDENPDPMNGQCQPAAPSDRLTIDVDLRAYPQPVNFVRLIGSFWGWNPNDGPVAVDPDGDGIYRVTFDAIPGEAFTYKWRINQSDTEDLAGAGACVGNANAFDLANRSWRPGQPNRVDVFGSCETCLIDDEPDNPQLCPVAPQGNQLTIDVDMRAFPGPINIVRLVGTFWDWNPNDGPVATDPDGDGIYRATFDGIPGAEFYYKWRVNVNVIEDLRNAGDCAGNTDNYDRANRRWSPGQPNRVDVYERCTQCVLSR